MTLGPRNRRDLFSTVYFLGPFLFDSFTVGLYYFCNCKSNYRVWLSKKKAMKGLDQTIGFQAFFEIVKTASRIILHESLISVLQRGSQSPAGWEAPPPGHSVSSYLLHT